MDPLSLLFSIFWLAHFDHRERPTRTAVRHSPAARNDATRAADAQGWLQRPLPYSRSSLALPGDLHQVLELLEQGSELQPAGAWPDRTRSAQPCSYFLPEAREPACRAH